MKDCGYVKGGNAMANPTITGSANVTLKYKEFEFGASFNIAIPVVMLLSILMQYFQ